MNTRTKYWTYIEDTPKHHGLIDKVAKEASAAAIAESRRMGVSITYLLGTEIIKESADGKITKVASLNHNRRKVQVGAKTKLSKE